MPHSPANELRRERIETVPFERLTEIRPAWHALWHETAASPFLSPAWLLPWAEVYAPGRMYAAVLWVEQRLCALLPVFTWEKRLLLAGTGVSDHGGALFRPGSENRVAGLVAAALAVAGPVDAIDFQQLDPHSPLGRSSTCDWQRETTEGDACLVLPLGGANGFGAVPSEMRRDWQAAMRRLGRAGGRIARVPAAEVASGIEDLIRLHQARWRARKAEGVLADSMLTGVLRRAALELARDGLLFLTEIRLGGASIATLLALKGERETCYYLSGFDPAHARLSPGTVLIGATIQLAAAQGARRFSFLRGNEAYKARWGAHPEARLRRTFLRP